ncbi:uncharacterized protein LOC141701666 [Apium graveolens]|uniref:uncharacterized protein LOC141701666 n=1 Tax=Apium graveolens TaxID=4045 RepID=UPI003D79C3B5
MPFIFLIETIAVASRIEDLRIKLGFSQYFAVDCRGCSGGLAIFWKSSVDCSVTGYSRNHVDVVFNENNIQKWRLTCFYGFPNRSQRKQSWELICRLSNLSNLPWCIMGDFNDILYSTDKKGLHPHPDYLMRGFRNTLDESELTEVELQGGCFTWENSRGKENWVQEKLDRAFTTLRWWNLFPLCKLGVITTTV